MEYLNRTADVMLKDLLDAFGARQYAVKQLYEARPNEDSVTRQ